MVYQTMGKFKRKDNRVVSFMNERRTHKCGEEILKQSAVTAKDGGNIGLLLYSI